jgi:hypothetical protein
MVNTHHTCGYYTLEMWLIQIEMWYKCTLSFKDLVKNAEYLIGNFLYIIFELKIF